VRFIAQTYDVSPVAVDKWVRSGDGGGCPVAATVPIGKTGSGGGRVSKWFDPKQVQAWVSAYRPHHGHGGKRSGKVGRPSTKKPLHATSAEQPLIVRMEQKQNARQGGLPELDPDFESQRPMEGTLTFEKIRHERVKAERAELELAKEKRELLPRTSVEEAIGSAARTARVRLEMMGIRLTSEILGACRLGTEFAAVVQDLISAACLEVLEELVRDPLGDGEPSQQQTDAATRVAA
jgi:hypothetical protein